MGYPPPSRPGWGTLPWNGVPPTIQTIKTWLGYPLPSRPGQGTPPPQTWDGVPPPTPDLRWGTPHHPDLDGVPPQPQTWDGVPPTIQTWMGYPPRPPRNVNRQTPVKTVPSLVLRTRAAKMFFYETTLIRKKQTLNWLLSFLEYSNVATEDLRLIQRILLPTS